jgi:hypothetical protein
MLLPLSLPTPRVTLTCCCRHPPLLPQARHAKLGGPRPCLRVVSYHADTTNRSPTFDFDLPDLYTPDPVTGDPRPLPYAVLREQLQQEPATAWGAYVAGCLLVLAHETGVVFDQGVSMLIVSDVPEGERRELGQGRRTARVNVLRVMLDHGNLTFTITGVLGDCQSMDRIQ